MKKFFILSIAITCLSTFSMYKVADAAFINTWDTQVTFQNENQPLSMESFEGIGLGFTSTQLTVGGITISEDSLTNLEVIQGSNGVTEGNQALRTLLNDGESITFAFSSQIHKFGVNITYWGTAGAQAFTFYDDLGNSIEALNATTNPAGGGIRYFFGVRSDVKFSTAMFTQTGGGIADDIVFDELYYGVSPQPVPEPTTIALLGIGLVGLAGAEVRRRRKRKAVDNS
jgi:hypothetical protein